MKLDFGSGFNPKKGYKTLDRLYGCDYYNISELENKSVTKLHMRNVLHHIEDIDKLFDELEPKLHNDVEITIIECNKDHYKQNYFLDVLWYVFINNDKKMFISKKYRDYKNILLKKNYICINSAIKNEKEILTFKKGDEKMNDSIKKELEEAGFDYAVAIATKAEVEAGAACGQLSIITDKK